MKQINLIIILLIGIYLCFSCKEESINYIKLSPIKEYQVNFPNAKEGEFLLLDLVSIDDQTYLQKLNMNNKTLDLVNIFKNSNVHIPLDSIFKIAQSKTATKFFIHNLDSIFLFPHVRFEEQDRILLINQKGEIKNTYFVPKDKYYVDRSQSSLLFYNQNLYLATYYFEDVTIPITDNYDFKNAFLNRKTELVIDTKKKKIKYHMGEYPSNYVEDYYELSSSQRCFKNKGELVVAFPCSHDLMIYKEDELIKKKSVKSRFIDKFIPCSLKKSNNNFNYLQKYYIENPAYKHIIYDKYRDMYYRIVKHYANPVDESGEYLTKYEDVKHSIMFIDKDFNLIDEKPFDIKKYLMSPLPTPEGLLLAEKGDSTFWEHKTMNFTLFDLQIEKKK